MASGPITSWQIDGGAVETVADFIFWAPKSLRWWLHPWNLKMLTICQESYDQTRQHIKNQRHYFVQKGPSSQGYVFSCSMYRCESCTIKKAECQRTDAFELWCWGRLLSVPWTARRFNQCILKEISRWCHPTISSSVIPFSSCPQSFPASGSFKGVSTSHQVAKVLEFQIQQ